MPKGNDKPKKGADATPPKAKPEKDTLRDLDVDKEISERVRGGRRRMISG